MDLYTASNRLWRGFRSHGETQERVIGDHALIGDGASCALVSVDGSIAWLCLPRFDSPSVFAQILDRDRGGTCRVAPASGEFESLQAYDESTNVLQTLFRSAQGVVQLTDFMPWSGDDDRFSVHELHRLIEVREGSVEMELVFDPPSLETMLRVRSAWDRHGRMNPGKLLPVHICMEVRTRPIIPSGEATA